MVLEKNLTLTHRIDLTNVYGQSLGYLNFDENMDQRSGYVMLNDMKYYFAFPDFPRSELHIFTTDKIIPVQTVSIPDQHESAGMAKSETTEYRSMLVLGLCWYMQYHVAEKLILEADLAQ